MAIVIKYSTSTTPNPVTQFLPPGTEGAMFQGQPNTLILDDSTPTNLGKYNAVIALLSNDIPQKYWKHVNGDVLEMTPREKARVDDLERANQSISNKTSWGGSIGLSGAVIARGVKKFISIKFNVLSDSDVTVGSIDKIVPGGSAPLFDDEKGNRFNVFVSQTGIVTVREISGSRQFKFDFEMTQI